MNCAQYDRREQAAIDLEEAEDKICQLERQLEDSEIARSGVEEELRELQRESAITNNTFYVISITRHGQWGIWIDGHNLENSRSPGEAKGTSVRCGLKRFEEVSNIKG